MANKGKVSKSGKGLKPKKLDASADKRPHLNRASATGATPAQGQPRQG